jgi:predicted oxidoreductase
VASRDRLTTAPVIVIGGGITGLTAALELLSAGREVLVLDRDVEENFGGLAKESFGGFLVVDTPVQRRHGIRDSVALALSDWTRFGRLSPADGWPYRWAEAYVNDCRADVYDWLRAKGLRFLPMPHWVERDGNSVPRWHVVWGSGERLTLQLIQRLRSHPQARALTLRFSHRVDRLLVSGGKVTGCAGVREDTGEPFEYAGDAVLIAAGGINGSLEEVRKHWPAGSGAAPRSLLNGAHRYADGTMHAAVARLDGHIGDLSRMWNYAAGVRHWRPRKPDHGISLVPPRGALWLDQHGARFDPPLLAGLDTSQQVERIARAGGISWQILNRRIAIKELAASGAEFNRSLRDRRPLAFLCDLLFGNRWLVDTLLKDCPDFIAANSLPELVEKMNAVDAGQRVDLASVERAVRDYDAAIVRRDRNADPQVANIESARRWKGDRLRTAKLLPILDKRAGPLIAIRERIISRKSLGGIVTDLQGRVLTHAGAPIPGLYAAGEATGFGGGGMNGARALEGTFLGGCIYSARRAARALG